MRKLNLRFVKDIGSAGGAAGLAVLYEEIAGAAVIDATAQDKNLSGFDIALQMLVGWGPLIFAATRPSGGKGAYFWHSFAGAIACNRVDNLAIAFGQPALTPLGPIRPGETMAAARARLGTG